MLIFTGTNWGFFWGGVLKKNQNLGWSLINLKHFIIHFYPAIILLSGIEVMSFNLKIEHNTE
jgi:hypothetical protein